MKTGLGPLEDLTGCLLSPPSLCRLVTAFCTPSGGQQVTYIRALLDGSRVLFASPLSIVSCFLFGLQDMCQVLRKHFDA